jgi:hypothetical protein
MSAFSKITIDPHYCSREEYEALLDYLTDNSWDYKHEGSLKR